MTKPPIIAVEGCCHGELDTIYKSVIQLEQQQNIKVDLLIVCGDFQALRSTRDYEALNVPNKYRRLGDFSHYYTSQKEAPVLTIFIGGNHESSSYLSQLYYGGWVAPKIYYLGAAGVINYRGMRIGGLSGIFSAYDYDKGHWEQPPYSSKALRSVYHIRKYDVFKLTHIEKPLTVMLSHDWPRGVYHHGNLQQLLQRKPFFTAEIKRNELGSPPAEQLLKQLQPCILVQCAFACTL